MLFYHQHVAEYKLYPPAEEATALYAKCCPILGTCVTDSILVHAPNLNKCSWPSSCWIFIEFADTYEITP